MCVCVCVCVCERERERERCVGRDKQLLTDYYVTLASLWLPWLPSLAWPDPIPHRGKGSGIWP